MNEVFIDTGPLVAFISERDQYHQKSQAVILTLLHDGSTLS